MGLATNDCGGNIVINRTNVTCPQVIACIMAQPTGAPAVAGDLVQGSDGQFHALPAQSPQTLSLSGNTVTLSGGGGSIIVPDLDTQDLSIAGDVISLTNGGSVTLPAVPFATPAQTVAGISTALVVNPADLFARESIPAQLNLSNDVTAIPAPTAGQSYKGVNLLGEMLEYFPGQGWKIVGNFYSITLPGAIATPVTGNFVHHNYIVPRAGTLTVSSGDIYVCGSFSNENVSHNMSKNGVRIGIQNYPNTTNVNHGSISVSVKVQASDSLTYTINNPSGVMPVAMISLPFTVTYTA